MSLVDEPKEQEQSGGDIVSQFSSAFFKEKPKKREKTPKDSSTSKPRATPSGKKIIEKKRPTTREEVDVTTGVRYVQATFEEMVQFVISDASEKGFNLAKVAGPLSEEQKTDRKAKGLPEAETEQEKIRRAATRVVWKGIRKYGIPRTRKVTFKYGEKRQARRGEDEQTVKAKIEARRYPRFFGIEQPTIPDYSTRHVAIGSFKRAIPLLFATRELLLQSIPIHVKKESFELRMMRAIRLHPKLDIEDIEKLVLAETPANIITTQRRLRQFAQMAMMSGLMKMRKEDGLDLRDVREIDNKDGSITRTGTAEIYDLKQEQRAVYSTIIHSHTYTKERIAELRVEINTAKAALETYMKEDKYLVGIERFSHLVPASLDYKEPFAVVRRIYNDFFFTMFLMRELLRDGYQVYFYDGDYEQKTQPKRNKPSKIEVKKIYFIGAKNDEELIYNKIFPAFHNIDVLPLPPRTSAGYEQIEKEVIAICLAQIKKINSAVKAKKAKDDKEGVVLSPEELKEETQGFIEVDGQKIEYRNELAHRIAASIAIIKRLRPELKVDFVSLEQFQQAKLERRPLDEVLSTAKFGRITQETGGEIVTTARPEIGGVITPNLPDPDVKKWINGAADYLAGQLYSTKEFKDEEESSRPGILREELLPSEYADLHVFNKNLNEARYWLSYPLTNRVMGMIKIVKRPDLQTASSGRTFVLEVYRLNRDSFTTVRAVSHRPIRQEPTDLIDPFELTTAEQYMLLETKWIEKTPEEWWKIQGRRGVVGWIPVKSTDPHSGNMVFSHSLHQFLDKDIFTLYARKGISLMFGYYDTAAGSYD